MPTRPIRLAALSFLLSGSSSCVCSFPVPPSQIWHPQDLTTDNEGFPPIPDDDYIKRYQRSPAKLWPVEFFVIAHRLNSESRQTELLVRRSANGTSKYGLGTGVPATRWVLSTGKPPVGYEWSDGVGVDDDQEATTFPASFYPEYDAESCDSKDWIYRKIDIREDAFGLDSGFQDVELEKYAAAIRDALRQTISKQRDGDATTSSWEATRLAIHQNVLDKQNSIAAIQGSLRMSGLFAERTADAGRYLELEGANDPAELAENMRIYTMFPQMPDPMPHPSTSAEELSNEIRARPLRMVESGRNPHVDKFGRVYTHISTNNVSNTIIGCYLSFDVTGLPGLDDVPALDLFGTDRIAREWVSLEDLAVLDKDGSIGSEDPKSTFISGFIIRQLVKEGVIPSGSRSSRVEY